MAVNIGPKIGIDGESEYRQQINNIIQQAKTLASEMKAVTAGFDESTSAQEKAKATGEILAQQIKVQQERVAKLTEMLGKSTAELGENDTKTLKWKQAVLDATAELSQMEQELSANNAALEESATEVNDYAAALAALDTSTLEQQMKTLQSEMRLLSSEFDENTKAQEKARAKAQVLGKQVQVQAQRVKELEDILEKAKKEYGENSAETLKWEAALNDAKAELNKLNNELGEAQTQSSKFRTAMSKVGAGLKDLKNNGVNKLCNALKSGLKSAVKGAIATLGTLTAAAASTVLALGKIGLDYNMEMETYTTNFETMLGSAEAAAAKVESLKDMAAATPFEMRDLADATQQLLAMGVASEDTNKYLQQLGDISLGNADKFNSLVGAFGKMNSTGKVTLEYINMMAEQGFNPLNLIAEKTGESMTEVYARVSDGAVTFDEIKDAIAAATSAGGQFYQGMEKASKTTAGMISTLKDNATALVGEVFVPISEGLTKNLLPKANDAITRLSNAFKEKGISGMVRAAGTILGETIGEFTEALPEFANLAVDIVENLLLGIEENLDPIADGAVQTFTTLAEGIIELAPELTIVAAKLIAKLAVGLVQALPDLISQIPSMLAEICAEFKNAGPEFKKIGKEIIWGLWDGIVAIWNEMLAWLENAWDGLCSIFTGKTLKFKNDLNINIKGAVDGAIGGIEGYATNGSHANGLNYVPYDGYIAELHRGEMVLTRSEASALRRGETAYVGNTSVNYGGFSFYIYASEGQNVEEIADAVYERFQTDIQRREAAFT